MERLLDGDEEIWRRGSERMRCCFIADWRRWGVLGVGAEPGFYISLSDFFEILSIVWGSLLRRGFYQEWGGRTFGRVPSLAFKRVGPPTPDLRALDLRGFGRRLPMDEAGEQTYCFCR